MNTSEVTSVRSTAPTQPAAKSDPPAIAASGAPISRRHLDTTRRPMRSLLGLVLVVYSAWSTIQVAGAAFPDVAWWHVGVGLGMSLGYILGALLAGAITLSEVYLGESRPFAYLLIVAFDAYLTQQYSSWAYDLLHSAITITNLSLEAFLVGALVWFASGLCAYFGEVLLLGSRRRARWKQR